MLPNLNLRLENIQAAELPTPLQFAMAYLASKQFAMAYLASHNSTKIMELIKMINLFPWYHCTSALFVLFYNFKEKQRNLGA